MARSSRRPEREAGFTLIEMIVVLAVLALVGSIVLARGPMRSASFDVRAAARTLAAELRASRARAIAADRDVAFVFDPRAGTYGARNGPQHRLPGGIGLEAPKAPLMLHPDGSTSGGVVTLSEQDRHVAIRLDWLTGRVSMD